MFLKVGKIKSLTIKDRLKVLEMIQTGQSQRSIASELGISKTQVQQIGKSKDELLAKLKSRDVHLCAKITVNVSQNKLFDAAVCKWFSEMRNPKFRCKACQFCQFCVRIFKR